MIEKIDEKRPAYSQHEDWHHRAYLSPMDTPFQASSDDEGGNDLHVWKKGSRATPPDIPI